MTDPITEDSLVVYDNTRINAFKQCPRYYYLQHVRNWRPAGRKNIHLAFGSAWHEAMDVVWSEIAGNGGLNNEELLEKAMIAFRYSWVEDGFSFHMDEDEEKKLLPKTPMIARETLINYIKERRPFIERIELLEVEKPFVVPLMPKERPSLMYGGRWDKVIRDGKVIRGIEHKTTGKYAANHTKRGARGGFRTPYLEKWNNDSQVKGYIYGLAMEYGKEALRGGVYVDAAMLHKDWNDIFIFIPVERMMPMLQAWLWETLDWISKIEANLEKLEDKELKGREYMAAFSKRDDKECEYCDMRDLCMSYANPAQRDLPHGYKVEVWDPVEALGLTAQEKKQ